MNVLSMLSAGDKCRFLPILILLLLIAILSWLSSAFLIQDFASRVLFLGKYNSILVSLVLSVLLVFFACLASRILMGRVVLFFTLQCLLPATILTFIGGNRLLCSLTIFLGVLGLFVMGRRRCLQAIHVLGASNHQPDSIILSLRLNHYMWWQPYAARYGLIHIGVWMSATFSLTMTGLALMNYYLLPYGYMPFACVGAALLMCGSFFFSIQGSFKGAWVLFFILIFCLFSCLPLILEFRHKTLALLSFVFPAVGLYWMSTRRYQRGLKVLAVARRARLRLEALEAAILKT
ncbi:hypothetical protein [Pseudomonas agarici]|uniref:hypothetical protein n=1 Tax=Pseudomonas agarici TaxID=46677 RepID=UPI00036A1C50|nr:hypothetical protein [Pseudomonas agarici]NWB93483.1 hypothetical protein [Pseudomonas agarici]NWC11141.1 hypothetical protein [Pseudomonas agarici]SEK98923.1 hypothetical protein SAMN05216604_10983 [Pseudomonas agarici]